MNPMYLSLVKDLKIEDFQNFKIDAYSQCEQALATLEKCLPSTDNAGEIRQLANEVEALAANIVVIWVAADAYLDLAMSANRLTKEDNPKMTEEDRKVHTDARVVEYRTIRNMAERVMDIIKSKIILATKNMSMLEQEMRSGLAYKMADSSGVGSQKYKPVPEPF
jgi:hypothetical protein